MDASRMQLTLAERQQVLQTELRRWLRFGYRVTHQTDTTVQLVRPREFSFLMALILVFTIVGFVIYLLWYLTREDDSAFLEVNETGEILRNGRPWITHSSPAARIAEAEPVRVALPTWPFKLVGAAFGFAMLIGVGLYIAERFAPQVPAHRGPRDPVAQTGSGEWQGYRYTFATVDREVTVRLTPALKGAESRKQSDVMRHLANAIFGDDVATIEPQKMFDRGEPAVGFPIGMFAVKFRAITNRAGDVEALKIRRE
jgi:hypothetical protein